MRNRKKTVQDTTVMRRYEYRIYPSETQANLFVCTFGCVRFVYNKLLREKIDHYRKTEKMLVNTPAHLKVDFPWLADVDSYALCNAQLALQTAFSNFFRDKFVGFPRFKSKKSPTRTYTTNRKDGNVGIVRDDSAPKRKRWKLKLPKAGLVDIVYHRPIPDGWSIKSVTVKMSPSGQFHASVLCDTNTAPVHLHPWMQISSTAPRNIEEIPDKRVVGLDYSMPSFYVSSDGVLSPQTHRFFRTDEQKIAREKRKLAKCEKGSKNRQKQKRRIARMEQRVADRRKNFLHQESRRIANAFDIVCVEDIDMQNMSRSLNFGKSVYDNGWGVFRRMLEYKLAEKGGRLVKIDRYYPSSKICSVCGQKKESLSLSERTYRCEACGNEMDRDFNAAVNIRNEGLRMLTAVA